MMAQTIREIINQAADAAAELVGTPKQIALAETLRETRIDDIIATLRRMQDGFKMGLCTKEELMAAVKRGVHICKITRAAWWIEQRGNHTTHLLEDEFASNLK